MTIVFSTYFSPSLLLSPHFLPDHLDISIGDLDLIVFEKSSGGKKGLLSGARARALFSTWVVENWLFARWLNGSWQKVLLLCKGSEFSSEIQSDEGSSSSKIAQKMLTELQFYCLKFWVKFWKKVFPNVSLFMISCCVGILVSRHAQSLENCGGSSSLLIMATAAFIKSSLWSIDMFQWAWKQKGKSSLHKGTDALTMPELPKKPGPITDD